MGTLLMRLAAPMQSWGAESKFEIRRTEREPTKSGVVGLLASALGRSRKRDAHDAYMSDLCALRFGVRVDREGELLMDFHMVNKKKEPFCQTRRYYLSDAVFLAGVECPDDEFLQKLDDALRHPVYPLFLGRRSCPPTQPLSLGIRQADLEEALSEEPLQISEYLHKKYEKDGGISAISLRMLLDADGENETVAERDFPISYDPGHRQYGYRPVVEKNFVKVMNDNSTEHDPMKELEE